MESRHYDLLLLTNIDVPWENDPQREHPEKREHFWNIYRKEAADAGIATVEISGTREGRQQIATAAIEHLLTKT